YFTSSLRRIFIYFGLPLAIFGLLAWIGASDVRARHPAEVAYFFALVRLFDFVHVGRQSFGVLQLWKRPLREALPSWSRSAENMFFVGAALMQWQTFWSGGNFAADKLESVVPAVVLFGLFVAISGSYLRPVLQGKSSAALVLGYFLVQAACSGAAIWRTWLYLTALAVHFLEYHVIMYPRCFAPGEQRSDWLRGRAWLFYGLLGPLVILFELRNGFQPSSIALGFLIHVFDGIFLAHYVLDAFLWRFGNPFYRDTLGPLYFAAQPTAARPRAWGLAAAAVGGLAFVGVLWWSQDALTGPIHAQNHLRWGLELAERGDLAAAEQHLSEALKADPSAATARSALEWVRERERVHQLR
ncbi:MAG TPA: hypothetical protein VJR89_09155, partial [Polyangiales bacterium]|nr:hypothetical protein [Polyangiales bacterium]